jgi:hypothetical protein
MKSSTHGLLSVAILVLLLALSYLLDRYVLAAAARTSELMDSSWLWAKTISRLTISTLLLGCAAFVLSPPRPIRTVGLVYLFTGVILTFTALPSVGALSVFVPFAAEWIVFDRSGIALPTTAAFLTVIGVAAFVRRYVPIPATKA